MRWSWIPNGQRPRGRSRMGWSHAVKTPIATPLRSDVFEDRQEWRRRLAPVTELALPGS